MTPLGPHADFIVTAYAAAIVIVIGLTAWVWSDYRAQRRALAELERRGVKRRSRPKRQ
jgi:heme exporter protein D